MKNITKFLAFALVAALIGSSAQVASAEVGYGGGGGSGGGSEVSSSRSGGGSSAPFIQVTNPVGRVLGLSTFNFASNLGQGTKNASVVELQNTLKSLGFFKFPTSTGFFGPITVEAVKAFQKANGINPTGFVGTLTRAELNKLTSKTQ